MRDLTHSIGIWIFAALVACVAFTDTDTAFAFEQTKTCYDPLDGRAPACGKKETSYPVRWSTPCTTWRTHEDFPDELLDALRASFEVWNEVPGSYFRSFYAGTTDQFGSGFDCAENGSGNENVVSYLEHWPATIAGSNVVALTSVTYALANGEILDADIRMNADHFNWSVIDLPSFDPKMVDVQNVMVHEVGHFLGLDHSVPATYVGDTHASDASMWAQTSPNEVKRRSLDIDDILGVESIYPLDRAPSAACVPPESLNHVSGPSWYDPARSQCSVKKSKGCCSAAESDPLPWPLVMVVGMMLLALRVRAPFAS